MKNRRAEMAAICLMMVCAGGLAQTNAPRQDAIGKERQMTTKKAQGTFDAKIKPQPPYSKGENEMLGRMSIDKQFHGDLEATSVGEMLTGGTVEKGSAGYVAIEQVKGTLGGKAGTFVLQHSGTMNRGEPTLSVSVVPDSGTGELIGLKGTMNILIAGGKHSYEFSYTLPSPQ